MMQSVRKVLLPNTSASAEAAVQSSGHRAWGRGSSAQPLLTSRTQHTGGSRASLMVCDPAFRDVCSLRSSPVMGMQVVSSSY